MSPLRLAWNALSRALEWLTIGLFAALVLAVLWGVVSRYTPGIRPSDWTEEISIYLLVWVSLLGGALAFREHGHLGVDYFVGKFDPAAQRLAAVVVELCVLLFAVILAYGGWRLVTESLRSGQLTPVLQWPTGYLYASVPLSGLFLAGYALEHLVALRHPAAPVPTSASGKDV